MVKVVPFEPHHVATLALQPAQEGEAVNHDEAVRLAAAGPAYALVGDDGTTYAICGLIPQWPGRAIGWGLIGYNAGPYLPRITRAVMRAVAESGYERVEATADAFFPAAHRWLEMMGFERETPEPMRRYGFNGRPAYLYARIAP